MEKQTSESSVDAEKNPAIQSSELAKHPSSDADSRWTNQRPFIVTEWHANGKWGTASEQMKCGICRRPFQVGDKARWICATGYRCLNFFVCEPDDTSDVIEVWQRITQLAQQDEYDLAARIVQLESDLGKCAAAESATVAST